MRFNAGIQSIPLNISDLPPGLLSLTRTRSLRAPTLDFFNQQGGLEAWVHSHVLPQLHTRVRSSLEGLTVRLDCWDFNFQPFVPRAPQLWHFDFPNHFYTSTFQALLVLGGDAPTHVLDPIEADSPEHLLHCLNSNPEAFPYQSYSPGHFIYADSPFVHRRGAVREPCFRCAFDFAQVYIP